MNFTTKLILILIAILILLLVGIYLYNEFQKLGNLQKLIAALIFLFVLAGGIGGAAKSK